MGVHGLWRLIEPSGKPVPLETLENKVLAVDISIWLHQAVKGFQDARGAPLPNAHLLGIYHRLCKLLYFKIKPVFVFDGGVPVLKKQTIAKRSQHNTKIRNDATSLQQKILTSLLKHSAIQKVLAEEGETNDQSIKKNILFNNKTKEDLFKLPEAPTEDLDSTLETDSSEYTESDSSPTKQWDLHKFDEKSKHFLSLPAELRHDILTDLKDQRKQSSWGRLHELPKKSGDFSQFQMKRLLKRYSVQTSLEEAEKEMGGHVLSLNELETLLTEQGIVTATNKSTKRIASDENKSYLLIKDVKKAMEKAKKEQNKINEETDKTSNDIERDLQEAIKLSMTDDGSNSEKTSNTNHNEYERDLQEAIKLSITNDVSDSEKTSNTKPTEYEKDLEEAITLSLMETPSTSKNNDTFDYLLGFNDGDFDSTSSSEEEYQLPKKKRSAAESYMLEYADLTPHEVENLFKKDNRPEKNKSKKTKPAKNTNVDNANNIENNDNIKNDIELNITHNKNSLTEENLNTIKDENNVNLLINSNEKSIDKNLFCNNINKNVDHLDSETKNNLLIEVSEDTKMVNLINITENPKEVCEKTLTVTDIKANKEIESETNLIEIKDNKKKETESMSDSDEADFVEVKTENLLTEKNLVKNDTIELLSESDDSDFVEINDEPHSPNKINFEVIIDPKNQIEDDIFKDIFSEPPKNIQPPIKNVEIVQTDEIKPKKVTFIDTSQDISEVENSKEILTNNEEKQNKNLDKLDNGTDIVVIKDDKKVEEVKKKPKMSVDELNKLQEELRKEQEELSIERNIKERMGSDITNQMYQEAQELLELFGVPYIIAPMEAEAQCAFLNSINLTDGTITDDSDIWLFGGQTVYKNFFNQKKHVLEYRDETIQHYFKLSREQMILLALLVGSDYTVGIPGIGPVTALEILAAFPPAKNIKHYVSVSDLLSGLCEFKHWLSDGGKLGLGRTTLRSKLQNIHISDGFPSIQVVQAYLQPEVETNKDAFTWGKPDVDGLIYYAREKFGWTKMKTEEILNPVIKKLEDATKQKSIKDYFATKHKIDIELAEGKVSKRVKIAIERMGKSKEELKKEEEEKRKKNKPKRIRNKDTTDKTTKDEETLIDNEGTSKQENKNEKKNSQKKDIKEKTKTRVVSDKPKVQRKTNPHVKEVIPQREKAKQDTLKSKLRAIEIYRKSKIEGKHDKKSRKIRQPKEDAELSESSDSM